ncbi:Dehydrogenase RED2-like protein [Elsinoe fawcettii]|nr:Dehydrogenase RED2-like protein [Elsinoe fawcettii]
MSWLRSLPLTPIAAGASFYLLSLSPEHIREPLLQRLSTYLSPQQIKNLITTLKWIFIAKSVTYTNGTLNELSLNNYHSEPKSKWVWSQEIAVITGASSGFGKLFTQDLTAKGIHVVGLDVNDAPQDLLSNKRFTFIKCDVTDADAVREAADQIKSTVGNPSILINNAGIAGSHSIVDTSPQALQKIVGVNLLSHYYLVQQFLPDMVSKKKGHIVSIASMASFISNPLMVDYCVTKAGVLAFHEGLTSELRAVHKCPEIKTTIVHPLWAATAMVAAYTDELTKGGQRIMDPQIVSDAVVSQIVNRRSGKLILGHQTGILKRCRFYPDWLIWLVRQGLEKKMVFSAKAKKSA